MKLTLSATLLTLALSLPAVAGPTKAISKEDLMKHVSGWSKEAVDASDFMFKKYGAPNGMTPDMVVWTEVKPFKRSILYKEPVTHKFPMEHKDVLEHFIDYKAPEADKVAELWKFDGSVILEKTKGEMSARCDKEEANILALNLADEIVNGKRSVDDARMEYGRQILAMKDGNPMKLTQKLVFTPTSSAGDQDQPIMDKIKEETKQAEEE